MEAESSAVANAGPDQFVAADSTGFALVILDGSKSTIQTATRLRTRGRREVPTPAVGNPAKMDLPVGTYTVTLTVSDGFGGVSSSTVNISVSSIDVGITAVPSAGTIDPGGTLTYNATMTNNGPADATGVGVTSCPQPRTLSAQPPHKALAPVRANGTSGYVQCQIGNLAHGASVNLSITLNPKSAGTLTNSLNVFADQKDSNPSNDIATLVTQVGTSGSGGTGSGPGGSGSSGSCACTRSGSYVDPAQGVDVAGDPQSSPSNKYIVTASIDNANGFDNITITRRSGRKGTAYSDQFSYHCALGI